MSNNMQAGGNTCPAGPLDDADSLPNLPRCCDRQRISPNLPRCCDRQRNSPNLPRCCDRRRVLFSSSSCDSDCSDSDSFTHAFPSSSGRRGPLTGHDMYSPKSVRRDMQIFSPCPRAAVQVSPSPAGRFFHPYRQGEAQAQIHGPHVDETNANSCAPWQTIRRGNARCATGKVEVFVFPVSNSFQVLSCNNGFGPDDSSGTTPGPAEDASSDVTSYVPQPPHRGCHSSFFVCSFTFFLQFLFQSL